MQSYQDQIAVLTGDLESQSKAAEQRGDVNRKTFEAFKQLEADKAQVDDEVESLKARVLEIETENTGLHQVTQESNDGQESRLKLTSELELLRTEHDGLLKENEYYKDDLLPTMREKSQEMTRKFREFEAERNALAEENATMRQGNQSDNEQLAQLRQLHQDVTAANEVLKT